MVRVGITNPNPIVCLVKQRCTDGKMEVVGEETNVNGFVCQKSWIDCTKEYSDWAEANCGGKPLIAQ